MHVEFGEAGWAWAAGAMILLAVPGVLGARRSWRWRVAAVILPLCAAAAALLALAGPRLIAARDLGVVILLDLSDSTRNAPWHDPAWVRRLAALRLDPARPITIVEFAARPQLLAAGLRADDPQPWPLVWDSPGDGRTTDLPAALAWRSDSEKTGGGLAPRWIISDGLMPPLPTGGRASVPPAALPGLSPPSSFPQAYTLVSPTILDAGITDLSLRRAAQGIEIMAQVRVVRGVRDPVLSSSQAAPAASSTSSPAEIHLRLRITRDDLPIADEALAFHTGDTASTNPLDASRWISVLDTRADPTLAHRYRATLALASAPPPGGANRGDPWPENDAAAALWTAPEPRRTLVISAGAPALAPPLAIDDSFAVRRISVDQFQESADDLALEGVRAVVLDDVPAEARGATAGMPALTLVQARELHHFVTQFGGGLVIVARGHAMGPGHYADGNYPGDLLDDLSPFWSRPRLDGKLHLIFLLDVSGSMNAPVHAAEGAPPDRKFSLLLQAFGWAASLLAAQDRLSVVVFNGESHIIADGPASQALSTIGPRFAQVAPTGPTSPDSALADVGHLLAGDAPDEERVILLLTDGDIPAMNIERWRAILAPSRPGSTPVSTSPDASFRPPHVVLIAPAPAASAGGTERLSVVQQFATATGATWLPTDDPYAWQTLAVQAIAPYVEGRLRNAPIAWHSVEGRLAVAGGTASQSTQAWLKPDATLLAAGPEQQPLAAIVQRGLGQVAAMAMDDQSPSGTLLLKTLAERVMAADDRNDRRFTLSVQKSPDGGWTLMADGVGERGFLDHLRLEARTIGAAPVPPPPRDEQVPMIQSGPGHYEGHVHGGLEALIWNNETGQNLGTRSAQPVIGRIHIPQIESDEWPASVSGGTLMTRLPPGSVKLSGALNEPGRWNPPPTGAIGLGPWCWWCAALSAIGALLLRR